MFVNNLRRSIFLFSLLIFPLLFSTQSIAEELKTEAKKPGLKIQTLEGERVSFTPTVLVADPAGLEPAHLSVNSRVPLPTWPQIQNRKSMPGFEPGSIP